MECSCARVGQSMWLPARQQTERQKEERIAYRKSVSEAEEPAEPTSRLEMRLSPAPTHPQALNYDECDPLDQKPGEERTKSFGGYKKCLLRKNICN